MSDVIQHAKNLLEAATPGPWSLGENEVTHRLLGGEVYEYGGEPVLVVGGEASDVSPSRWGDEPPYCYDIHRVADGELMAASRELAEAVAEETWEYSYQVQNTIGMWEHPTSWAGETGKWWETKEDAEESALAAHEYGYPIRIVHRRVSPPEVINE